MLKSLLASMLAPLMGVLVLSGGFYLLFLAFLHSNSVQGVGGGTLVLLGMWLITRARRADTGTRP
jgi:hypothetical protein